MPKMRFDKPAAPAFLAFMTTFTALCLGLFIRGRKERASKIQGKEPPRQLQEQTPPHLEIKITQCFSQSRQLSPRHRSGWTRDS